MDFAALKAIKIPEGTVRKIECGGKVLWEEPSSCTNQVPISIDADGSIYNGIGYQDGYRIRSSGEESEQSESACTGFIPLHNGDTLRIYPAFTGLNASNAINFADAGFVNLGQVTDNGTGYGICGRDVSLYRTSVIDGVSALTLTDAHDGSIAYVRVTNNVASGAEMIVTVNEKIM